VTCHVHVWALDFETDGGPIITTPVHVLHFKPVELAAGETNPFSLVLPLRVVSCLAHSLVVPEAGNAVGESVDVGILIVKVVGVWDQRVERVVFVEIELDLVVLREIKFVLPSNGCLEPAIKEVAGFLVPDFGLRLKCGGKGCLVRLSLVLQVNPPQLDVWVRWVNKVACRAKISRLRDVNQRWSRR
jgi:hypothetical protein